MVRIANPCDEQLRKPYLRRLSIIEHRVTFTPDDDLVDEANHVYLEDCTLRGFYQSGDARCCYLLDQILPLMQRVFLEEAIDVLHNPTEEEVEQSRDFVRLMVRGEVSENERFNGRCC